MFLVKLVPVCKLVYYSIAVIKLQILRVKTKIDIYKLPSFYESFRQGMHTACFTFIQAHSDKGTSTTIARGKLLCRTQFRHYWSLKSECETLDIGKLHIVHSFTL